MTADRKTTERGTGRSRPEASPRTADPGGPLEEETPGRGPGDQGRVRTEPERERRYPEDTAAAPPSVRADVREGDGETIRPDMGAPGDGRTADRRSIPDLLRELSGEGADLVRQEVALAKAEMNEKVSVFERNAISMGLGAALMVASLVFLLWAVNYGLTALLTLWVGLEIASWLAPLILAAVAAPIGWAAWKGGMRSMKDEGVTPKKTMETLQRDRRWAEREAQKLREAMTHG